MNRWILTNRFEQMDLNKWIEQMDLNKSLNQLFKVVNRLSICFRMKKSEREREREMNFKNYSLKALSLGN